MSYKYSGSPQGLDSLWSQTAVCIFGCCLARAALQILHCRRFVIILGSSSDSIPQSNTVISVNGSPLSAGPKVAGALRRSIPKDALGREASKDQSEACEKMFKTCERTSVRRTFKKVFTRLEASPATSWRSSPSSLVPSATPVAGRCVRVPRQRYEGLDSTALHSRQILCGLRGCPCENSQRQHTREEAREMVLAQNLCEQRCV